MSHIEPGPPRPIASWDDAADWLTESFDALDVGDVFDLGPRNAAVDDPDVETPCAQAIALHGGILLRLSTTFMAIPALRDHSIDHVALDVWHHDDTFDDCTFGFIVSADTEFLAATCGNWFRDAHGLDFAELGCELVTAVSLESLPHRGEGNGRW